MHCDTCLVTWQELAFGTMPEAEAEAEAEATAAAAPDAPPAEPSAAETQADSLRKRRAESRAKGREIGRKLSRWVDRHQIELMGLLGVLIFTDLGSVAVDVASQAVSKVHSWNLPSLLYYLVVYQLGYVVLCAVGRVIRKLVLPEEAQADDASTPTDAVPPAPPEPPPETAEDVNTTAVNPAEEDAEQEDASCFFDDGEAELELELEPEDAKD